MKKTYVLNITQVAVLAAMTAVLSQIAIPMPTNVPLTLQTFAVALCAYIGGLKKGVPAIAVYLAVGAVGAPVFANFKGGISALLGYTGGFLWGFLLMALVTGLAMLPEKMPLSILGGLVGLLCCHCLGALQYAVVAGIGFGESFMLVCVPYLLKDAISVLCAYAAALAVRKALQRAGLAV